MEKSKGFISEKIIFASSRLATTIFSFFFRTSHDFRKGKTLIPFLCPSRIPDLIASNLRSHFAVVTSNLRSHFAEVQNRRPPCCRIREAAVELIRIQNRCFLKPRRRIRHLNGDLRVKFFLRLICLKHLSHKFDLKKK